MKEIDGSCLDCGGKLIIRRTWTRVYLSCRACGAKFPQDKYKELMDEYLEEQLANVPINRL